MKPMRCYQILKRGKDTTLGGTTKKIRWAGSEAWEATVESTLLKYFKCSSEEAIRLEGLVEAKEVEALPFLTRTWEEAWEAINLVLNFEVLVDVFKALEPIYNKSLLNYFYCKILIDNI